MRTQDNPPQSTFRHSLEVVRAAHVGHPSVVVVAEVRAVAGALVKQVVRSFLRSKISKDR